MQFRLKIFLSLSLAVICIVLRANPQNSNLIKQFGSDGLPHGWSEFYFPGAETIGKVSADNMRHNNKPAVKIAWQSGTSGFGISYRTTALVGKSYQFSARGKSADGGKLQIMVMAYDQNGDIVMSCQSNELKSIDKWSNLKTTFTVPKKTVSLQLLCLNEGEGIVWFDTARLQPVAQLKTKTQFPIQFGCEPARGNAIWNQWRPIFSTFIDSPCSLTFDFWGDKTKLKNSAFVIELPAAITIAECFNSHGNNPHPTMSPKITAFTRNGQRWLRYTYRHPAAIKMIKIEPSFWRSITVLFKPNTANTIGKEFPAVAYAINNGKKGSETKFFIKILPPMAKTPNPKKFYVHLWSNYDIAVSNDQLFKNIIKRFEEAGMTGRTINNWGRKQLAKQDNLCRSRGWKMHLNLGSAFMKSSIKPFFKDGIAATTYQGKKSPHICPSILLSNKAQSALKNAFIKLAKDKKLRAGDMVIFDYEPWGPFRWCFCPKCRARFSRFVGSNKTLTTSEIRSNKQLKTKWVQFRVHDSNSISKKLNQMVKNYNSAIKTADYDYPINFEKPGFEIKFGAIPKDTRLSDKYLDAHFSSFYYIVGADSFDMVDINRKVLKKAFFMLPLLTRYTDPVQGRYTKSAKYTLPPKLIRMSILNCASAGGSGQSFWTGNKIDGQYFLAIDKAMSEVAKFEDIFAYGKRIDKQLKYELSRNGKAAKNGFRVRAIEYKGENLICLFNYNKQQTIQVKIKFRPIGGDKWQIKIFGDKKRYRSPSNKIYWTVKELQAGIDITIKPEDVKFIDITPL